MDPSYTLDVSGLGSVRAWDLLKTTGLEKTCSWTSVVCTKRGAYAGTLRIVGTYTALVPVRTLCWVSSSSP